MRRTKVEQEIGEVLGAIESKRPGTTVTLDDEGETITLEFPDSDRTVQLVLCEYPPVLTGYSDGWLDARTWNDVPLGVVLLQVAVADSAEFIQEEEDSGMECQELNGPNCMLKADLKRYCDCFGADSAVLRPMEEDETVIVQIKLDFSKVLNRATAAAWGFIHGRPLVLKFAVKGCDYGPSAQVPVCKASQSKEDGTEKLLPLRTMLEHIANSFLQAAWGSRCIEEEEEEEEDQQQPARKKQRSVCSLTNCSLDTAAQALELTDGDAEGAAALIKTAPEMFQGCLSSSSSSLNFAPEVVKEEDGLLVSLANHVLKCMPKMNERCVICYGRHLFGAGGMLKPCVCSRELCAWSFQTLGVASTAAEGIAIGAEVIDLLVCMATAAAQSDRWDMIFNPFPVLFDPAHAGKSVISPENKRTDISTVREILRALPNMNDAAKANTLNALRDLYNRAHPLASAMVDWITVSNRSHLIKIPEKFQLLRMRTRHQFLLLSSTQEAEALFRKNREKYGSKFAFHGSPVENWHSILRNGLKNASQTKLQIHGAAFGNGIYMSPYISTSCQYTSGSPATYRPGGCCRISTSGEGGDDDKFLASTEFICLALCEVIDRKNYDKEGNIWVVEKEEDVVTRFFFVYKGTTANSISTSNISTSDPVFQAEIRNLLLQYMD